MKELARWHIYALAKSRGSPTVQLQTMVDLVRTGKAPAEILQTPPEEILRDSEAADAMLAAFLRVHGPGRGTEIRLGGRTGILEELAEQMRYAFEPSGFKTKK